MEGTYVVDASVAAKWILKEPRQEDALEWLARYLQGEIFLFAPDLLLAEFASLVVKRNRRKQLTAAQARDAYQMMRRFTPVLVETRPLLEQALQLSLRYALSLWDCVYLAAAMGRGFGLITADRRFYRGVAKVYPKACLL